jgi:hypothetical protein
MTRARSLRNETAINSISPERAGGIMYDTLAYINEMQLQDANPLLLSKIYDSVAEMEADPAPVSDLDGSALLPGQLVCIVTGDPDDPEDGAVYRYDGTEDDTSSWTAVGRIGSAPYLEGFLYMGKAVLTPTPTDPGAPTQKVFYEASEPGTYGNFGNLVVNDGEIVYFKFDGDAWSKDVTGAASAKSVERKTGSYDKSGELVAGSPAEHSIAGPFSSGQIIRARCAGTASVASGAIKMRDDASTALASLSINGDSVELTLASDTDEIKFVTAGGNITASGKITYYVETGPALAPEQIAALQNDVSKNRNVLNISELFPTGGTGGTNVYATRADARAKCTIGSGLRKLGAILTYLTPSGWVLEEFVGSATSDWTTATRWRDLTEGSNVYVYTMGIGESRADVRNKVPWANRQTGAMVVYFDGLAWCIDQFINSDVSTWSTSRYETYWADLLKAGQTPNKKHSLEMAQGLAEQGIAVTGTPGTRGATYEVELQSGGIFVLSFEFKFPRDIQQTADTLQLAKLDKLSTGNVSGGFCIDIFKALPTAQAPFAQPYFGAGLNFYGIAQKNNAYGSRYRPSGTPNKQFVGKDAVAIRYAGDITQAANRDVVLTINDTGLVVKHSTNDAVIVSEPFPVSKSMNEWAATLATKCASGGAYDGIIEFVFLLVEGYSTDDLLRVADIPLVGDYSAQDANKGWQAFPCFLPYYDDEWHTIDVRVDFSKQTSRDVLVCLFDGTEISCPSTAPGVTGNGVFSATFTLGGSDILVRNFSFEQNKTQTGRPKIIVCMTHGISDGVYDPETPNAYITLGRMQWLLNTFKAHGFEHITYDEIAAYINGNGEVPDKCFTIIHDDQYYYRDWSDPLSSRFRQLMMQNNARVSFCPTITEMSYPERVAAMNKDKSFFCFHPHGLHGDGVATKHGYADFMTFYRTLFSDFRDKIGASNLYTYPEGKYDVNVIKLLGYLGICYSSLVGNNVIQLRNYADTQYLTQRTLTFTSRANNALSQPRLQIDDNDLTEERLAEYLDYMDSI